MTPTTPCCEKCWRYENNGCLDANCRCHATKNLNTSRCACGGFGCHDSVHFPPTKNLSWEEEFDETVRNRMRTNNDALLRNEIPWIGEFIRSLLTQQKNELIGIAEGMKVNDEELGLGKEYDKALTDIIRTLD